MGYADISDVKDRWISSRELPSDSIVSAYLMDASVILDATFPSLADKVANEPVVAARAKMVCANMVYRALSNPDKIRQVSEGIGPESGSITYSSEGQGGLRITAQDRDLISQVLELNKSQAGQFSTLPYRPDLRR